MLLMDEFKKPLRDYLYLISRDYSSAGARDFVGNRYHLSREERSILYRGVFKTEESQRRMERLIPEEQLKNKILHIDTFNVLYTLVAYYNGFPLFIATDGVLRDAAEIHTREPNMKIFNLSLDRLFSCLEKSKVSGISLYIDHAVPVSHDLVEYLRRIKASFRIPVEYAKFHDPDEIMGKMRTGVLCTSDSELIQAFSIPVFDLPRHILQANFNPDFLDLTYLNA